jgi:hypothetical protein
MYLRIMTVRVIASTGTVVSVMTMVASRARQERNMAQGHRIDLNLDCDLLTLTEVASTLRVPLATARWWRANGQGPKTFRIGRRVVARRADVAAFIESQAVSGAMR